MNQLDLQPPTSTAEMQCMEVWGGNQKAHTHLELTGLDVWLYSRPHGDSESGGDVYYVSACASGRISRLLLADVSGHGQAVSQAAVELRNLMRRNINLVKQTRFVRAMNRQFVELQNNESFATALVATYFAPTRALTLCNAGHPHPFLFRCREANWSIIEPQDRKRSSPADIPLGVLEHSVYSETALRLETGDLALLFSDALIEAQRGDGEMFGLAGLLDIVRQTPVDPPEQMIPRVLSQIHAAHPDNPQQDDVSLVVLRATGAGIPLKDNLLAPFRILHGVTDRSKLS